MQVGYVGDYSREKDMDVGYLMESRYISQAPVGGTELPHLLSLMTPIGYPQTP